MGFKAPEARRLIVEAASTGNLTLSGEQTVDGVALTEEHYCLVKNQTTASENGVYRVRRSTWELVIDQPVEGEEAYVKRGTTNADRVFVKTGTFTFASIFSLATLSVTAANDLLDGSVSVAVTDDDSAATNGTAVFVAPRQAQGVVSNPLLETTSNVTVKDDDNAATTGTALFVVLDVIDHVYLASASAGAGPSNFTTSAGALIGVTYNADPAVNLGAVQVYFDEDGNGFLHADATAVDYYIPVFDGRLLKITYDASAATNGVAVYFDDDGATLSERLVFVSPTNADGLQTTDTALSAFGSAPTETGVSSNDALADLWSANAGAANATFNTSDAQAVYVGYDNSPTDLGAVQVYFDEDGTDKFLHKGANFAWDLYVPLPDGRLIKVAYDASADSNGVAVYFDDDGGTPAARLLFVSPTDTSGSATTDTSLAHGSSTITMTATVV